jgi:putative SOS response-associated peptidase YedK
MPPQEAVNMCGRFSITNPQAIKSEFNLREEIDFPPRYNIAPSQTIPIIKEDENGLKRLAMVRWGLMPFWAKDPKIAYKMINARAETLAEKPAFREAYKKRRCLIPADGFYEWKYNGKSKQPYYIHIKNKGMFAFAGLWESWKAPGGNIVESATIITTREHSPALADIHDRMPLIVNPKLRELWFDLTLDPIHNLHFLNAFEPIKIELFPVGNVVNDPKNDVPECVKKVL